MFVSVCVFFSRLSIDFFLESEEAVALEFSITDKIFSFPPLFILQDFSVFFVRKFVRVGVWFL